MAPIGGVGIELWTMQDGITFDNILLAHDVRVASDLAAKTFSVRQARDAELATTTTASLKRAPGQLGALKYFMEYTYYGAREQPLVAVLSAILALMPFFLLRRLRANREVAEPAAAEPTNLSEAEADAEAEAEREAAAKAAKAAAEVEDEAEEPAAEEPKRRSSPRKRTPRAT